MTCLLDNAEGSHDEADDDGHESVHSSATVSVGNKTASDTCTYVKMLFKVVSAKLVTGLTQKKLTKFVSPESRVLMKLTCVCVQKVPPTSARSVALKYPQHLN